MTNKKTLIITLVAIKAAGKIVYKENFHKGLNIIRGHNGTGKSTIMELISYGLGADIKKHSWKKEALACDEITIALCINGKNYVFQRAIEGENSHPPIRIYEGEYEESLSSNDGWMIYKNAKSENRKSYSMQIFDLLGIEQNSTADNESLTMHQFMRILYADQDTPAGKIFRTEPFIYDKESMRKAIGEYAFGFDDLKAHSLRQKLYIAEKSFEKLDEELKIIYRVLGRTNTKNSTKEIESEIDTLVESLNKNSTSMEILKTQNLKTVSTVEISKESIDVRNKISEIINIINTLESELISINYDISESHEFIESLKNRKTSLIQAQLTANSIGTMGYKFCPICLTEISTHVDNEHCYLCKSPKDKSLQDDSYIQSLNELDFQISETSTLIKIHSEKKQELTSILMSHSESLSRLRARFNEISSFTNDYEIATIKIANERGFIEAQIEALKEHLSLAAELDAKREAKQLLQTEINSLSEQLSRLEYSRKKRIDSVKNIISDLVIRILRHDEGVEPAFESASKFEFDFASDSIKLDDRSNFSASSNVLLKNSFHLAAFYNSVIDSEFRIPCFSMFDNIEDKGMVAERSNAFQRTIAELCEELQSPFQLIITTSMVDPTLNNDAYGVGPYYEKGTHTLAM